MSTIEVQAPVVFRPQRAALAIIGSAIVAFGVFLSGFVISEPAPYELVMVVQVAIWFLLGLRISRAVAPLLTFLLVFNVGGILSLTVMKDLADGPMYLAVSTFLALTSVFYAAIIEDDHRRLRLIFRAWVAAAVITALLGILGYFHAFPGAEAFTRYDRAMGAFQDPNVFGPFLIAPSLYLIHGLLTGRLAGAPVKIAGLLVIALGVFLSFSRAAWALFLFSAMALVLILLLKERTGTFRLKILLLSLAAVATLVVAVTIALQFEQVRNLFLDRTTLVKEYDGGHLGRFARHRIGFLNAMEQPFGIGPMVFSKIFPEDEHNIWLKSLTSYGWLGFISYISIMAWTVTIGFRYLLRNRPWQPYLMISWIVVIGHMMIGNVIDTDHWRHFYLLLGIVWGCGALEWRHQRTSRRPAGP
ncbi:O-antigen ligase family protein [Rhizobium cremeum]|uniref:O-antigen ligase family protein n=1 Tax=Rhizobium cremeum TaxID=2813827 RepID=UPI001FD0DCA3|nr:O-antigen ligase family protein [Rhizobium cremeum]MCJ7994710.1 O-antigen ligase family protein [Rhizobium cremeum]MCJ8000294.1 O-antigen ligase family protein [Rhizobium cremeum]